jgi:hypothetical protein
MVLVGLGVFVSVGVDEGIRPIASRPEKTPPQMRVSEQQADMATIQRGRVSFQILIGRLKNGFLFSSELGIVSPVQVVMRV